MISTHSLNGHTGAVKGKRKQDVLAHVPLKLSPKDGLCKGKGMTDMQHTVRVGIRERYNELFLLFGRCVRLVDLGFFP